MNASKLDEMNSTLNNFVKEDWNVLKMKIEKYHNYILSVEKPILIESYEPSKEVRTRIYITHMDIGGKNIVKVEALNMVEIKQRLICFLYGIKFDGETSLMKAKVKSEMIAFQLIATNK